MLSRAVGSDKWTTRSGESASGTRHESASASAAAQLEDSARRAVASWAGAPLLAQMIGPLRLAFWATLDELAIEDPGERCEAAARILGIGPVLPDGTEAPNPFAAWPEERLAPARHVAIRVRAAVGELVARLRADGVTDLWPVEHLPFSVDCPDGLDFGFAHVALLSLLWLDIPVEGRSGAQIAEALPLLGTVGWDRDRSTLLVGGASQPDILAGDTLRQAFVQRAGDAGGASDRANAGAALPVSDVVRGYLEAHPRSAAPTRSRRARGLADPKGTFERALVEAIHVGESRLSKTAIAARMGVDRKTLSRYIDEELIPPLPWELLAADLSGTSRPQ